MNPSRGCFNVPDVAFGASYSPESRDGLRVCMEKVPAGVGLGPTMGLEHSEQPAPWSGPRSSQDPRESPRSWLSLR